MHENRNFDTMVVAIAFGSELHLVVDLGKRKKAWSARKTALDRPREVRRFWALSSTAGHLSGASIYLETGCGYGGGLSCLLWPEREALTVTKV